MARQALSCQRVNKQLTNHNEHATLLQPYVIKQILVVLFCQGDILVSWDSEECSILHSGKSNSKKIRLLFLSFYADFLRAVCCKDRLRVCKIEKSDFPKLCQNKGLGELVLKI